MSIKARCYSRYPAWSETNSVHGTQHAELCEITNNPNATQYKCKWPKRREDKCCKHAEEERGHFKERMLKTLSFPEVCVESLIIRIGRNGSEEEHEKSRHWQKPRQRARKEQSIEEVEWEHRQGKPWGLSYGLYRFFFFFRIESHWWFLNNRVKISVLCFKNQQTVNCIGREDGRRVGKKKSLLK